MSNVIVLSFVGYIIGSIPFGFLLTKYLSGVDLRQFGSKSTGATNVLRATSKKVAAASLFLDVAKGALFTLTLVWMFDKPTALIPAFCCIVGHVYPIWLGFKGGKGVATTAGIFLILSPISAIISGVCWMVAAKVTKTSSLSSLIFAAILVISTVILSIKGSVAWMISLYSVAIFLFILLTHRQNIKRLIRKEEKSI